MKKSSKVVLGSAMFTVMALALSGCASGPDYEEVDAGNQEICVDRETGERVDFDKCDDDGPHGHTHFYPWYHSSTYGPAPAVGSKVNPSHGTSVRPANGTIARPPATGGFGRTTTSVGG